VARGWNFGKLIFDHPFWRRSWGDRGDLPEAVACAGPRDGGVAGCSTLGFSFPIMRPITSFARARFGLHKAQRGERHPFEEPTFRLGGAEARCGSPGLSTTEVCIPMIVSSAFLPQLRQDSVK
jgi:hypothetical protein